MAGDIVSVVRDSHGVDRSSRFCCWVMRVLQRVVHITHAVTFFCGRKNVPVLVHRGLDFRVLKEIGIFALDLDGMARELSEHQSNVGATYAHHHSAGGVDGGRELGGDIGDLRSGVFEWVVGVVGLVVVGGAAVVRRRVSVSELLWRGLVALGRGVGGGVRSTFCIGLLWRVVVALGWLLVGEAKATGSVLTVDGADSGGEEGKGKVFHILI